MQRPGPRAPSRLECAAPPLPLHRRAPTWHGSSLAALTPATLPSLPPAPPPPPPLARSTVMFVDEAGQQVSQQRLQLVQAELQRRDLTDVSFVEEEVEAASVGKGSVAVGEVADSVSADLVVLSTAGGGGGRGWGWNEGRGGGRPPHLNWGNLRLRLPAHVRPMLPPSPFSPPFTGCSRTREACRCEPPGRIRPLPSAAVALGSNFVNVSSARLAHSSWVMRLYCNTLMRLTR